MPDFLCRFRTFFHSDGIDLLLVIAGLDSKIQSLDQSVKDWMPGSKPAPDAIGGPGMTWVGVRAIRYYPAFATLTPAPSVSMTLLRSLTQA